MEKRGAFTHALTGGCWPGDAGGRSLVVGVPCDVLGVHVGCLGLVLSWKWGQKLEDLSVFNQVLAVLCQFTGIWLPGLFAEDSVDWLPGKIIADCASCL